MLNRHNHFWATDMVYRLHTPLFSALLSMLLLNTAAAQRGTVDQTAGRTAIPTAGTVLPVVKAFDDQGNEFSTASLRGGYSVLVFGCLT